MENKTNLVSFKSSLKEFTYTLLYPSLLGSMIFQIISEVFQNENPGCLINEFLVLFLYIIDWFFIRYCLSKEIEERKENNTRYHIFDILIPVLYTLSFFSIRSDHTLITCLLLSIALILIDIYLFKMRSVLFLFLVMTIVPILFTVINLFDLVDCTENLIFMNILLVIIYLVIARIAYIHKIKN